MSRATVYRVFPGGKDELLREAVGWEMGRFFGALAEAVAGAPDFASLVENGLVFAHRAVGEHEVLQKVLVTEPERLLPLMTIEQHRPLAFITAYLLPFLEREEREGRLRPGLDLDARRRLRRPDAPLAHRLAGAMGPRRPASRASARPRGPPRRASSPRRRSPPPDQQACTSHRGLVERPSGRAPL